jgi:hypothetical protein
MQRCLPQAAAQDPSSVALHGFSKPSIESYDMHGGSSYWVLYRVLFAIENLTPGVTSVHGGLFLPGGSV